MKTLIQHSSRLFSPIAVAAALLALSAAGASAQTIIGKGGATQLIPAEKTAAASPASPGRAAMNCPKCKTEFNRQVDRTARGATKQEILVAKHLCPTCQTTISVSGHGKAKQTSLNHKCGSCT